MPASRPAKSKFAIEPEAHSSILIDPEAYDASEQEFDASLEQVSAKPRFVVEPEGSSLEPGSRWTAWVPPADGRTVSDGLSATTGGADGGFDWSTSAVGPGPTSAVAGGC